MTRYALSAALLPVPLLAGPLSPAEALEAFEVEPGVRVELAAAERHAELGLLQGRCGAAVLGAGRRMRESCTRTRRLPTPFALLVSLLLTSRWALAGALLRSNTGAQPRASLSPPPAHDCGLWSRWSRPARP